MALTTVPSATVKTTLGESIYKWSELITSDLINKWSKYKPVKDTWPTADDNKYGLNLYAGSNPHRWDYLQPGGGSIVGEPFRAGDFRGYEHDRTLAYPSIQCRDTDNSWEANLYPSGSPYMQRWYCRAHRSASSVIIIPSDLGLDNYYVGIKTDATGGPWYKTFGQVKDLTFAKSWNASISCEIVDWDTIYPSFVSFPYHIGAVNWQLFLSYTAASDWTASAPTDILYFPGIANGGSPASYDTDGTNIYITSGSFTIKDWLKLSTNTLIHSPAGEAEDVTVYCSYAGGPPDWTASVITGGTWITLSYNDAGTPVAANLVVSGFNLRVTTDAIPDNSTVDCVSGDGDWTVLETDASSHVHPTLTRSPDGLVRVSSNGVTQDIDVQQGDAGNDQLTFKFKCDIDVGAPHTSLDVVITRGATVVYTDNSGTVKGEPDNWSLPYTVTINETAHNDNYVVTLTRH